MADFTATFEAGVHGATITTGAGEASLTAWDGVDGTPTYDNTRAAHGTLSGRFDAAGERLNWNLPTVTNHYGRIYLYLPALSIGNDTVLDVLDGGPAVVVSIKVEADGKVRIQDLGAANSQLSTNTVSTGQWIRIEYHVVHSATVGQVECKFFNTADSSTPTETITGPATWNTGTDAQGVRHGRFPGTNWPSDINFDDIVANATSYPGPAVTVTSNPAPVIYGRGAC